MKAIERWGMGPRGLRLLREFLENRWTLEVRITRFLGREAAGPP
jgi:hypothetical protein